MNMKLIIYISFLFLFAFNANCQSVMELSIKPSEIIFLNFETHIGIGSPKFQYGLLLSYRPSTQDSGVALKAGAGDRKSTRLNSSHMVQSRMPSSA